MIITNNQLFLGLVLLLQISVVISLPSQVQVDDSASSPAAGTAADWPRRRKITHRRRSAEEDGDQHHRDLGIEGHTSAIFNAIQTMKTIGLTSFYLTKRGGGGGGGTGEDALNARTTPENILDARNGNDTGKGKGGSDSKAPKATKSPTVSRAPKASKAPTACGGKGKGSSTSGRKVSDISYINVFRSRQAGIAL
jgi:hypothetical protein